MLSLLDDDTLKGNMAEVWARLTEILDGTPVAFLKEVLKGGQARFDISSSCAPSIGTGQRCRASVPAMHGPD